MIIMKFTKFFFISIILLILLSSSVPAQDIGQITFINELAGRKETTYGDALRMYRFQVGAISNSDAYLDRGWLDEFILTKGMLALLITKYHLKLNKSLMHKLFQTERYAYRACVAEKFFREDGSENDLVSGPELIEFFEKIGEFKGERQ